MYGEKCPKCEGSITPLSVSIDEILEIKSVIPDSASEGAGIKDPITMNFTGPISESLSSLHNLEIL